MRNEVDGDLSMFGSCFLKLLLTIVFENNILEPICLQFLKTIFCSKKKKNKENIKNTFNSLSFCYEKHRKHYKHRNTKFRDQE